MNLIWNDEEVSRLVLGTAQIGMSYGIANTKGRPNMRETAAIVEEAWKSGYTFFDTAQDYGECEGILGAIICEMGIANEVSIVTKLLPSNDPKRPEWILPSIEKTLDRLGVDHLWGLMLHREAWLGCWNDGLGECLVGFKNDGIVRHLGVSLYSVKEAKSALMNPDIDIVQLPCNVLDQRMLSEGVFDLARERNKICFVRSIYLQGFLTMLPEAVEKKMPFAAAASKRWHELAHEYGSDPVDLAMRFALALDSPLVVGVESVSQMKRNVAMLSAEPLKRKDIEHIGRCMSHVAGDRIINPINWGASS